MDVFRRAGQDLFNGYFEPYAETERDYEVFAAVEEAMFQVMVLDLLNVTGKAYGETISQIVVRPLESGTVATVQDADGTRVHLDPYDRIAFRRFFEEDWYAPRSAPWLLGEISVCSRDGLVGQAVIVDRTDVSFIDIEESA